MRFLISGGGLEGDEQFHNIHASNRITARFGLDNGCYSGAFAEAKFDSYLAKALDKKHLCLFIVMPDVMCDPIGTMKLWKEYHWKYKDWPLAFVSQDGQENLPYPPDDEWVCLFVGGSTEWKMSEGAKRCIAYAVERGKHIHIGRVNSYKRFRHFARLPGGDRFTCDGTKQRFEGREKANAIYRSFEKKYADSVSNDLFASNRFS